MSNLLYFLLPELFFLFVFLAIQLKFVKLHLQNIWVFGCIITGIVIAQLVTIVLIKQQVGDVMLFSDAGYYFRYGVDFYWIDKDHGQYPFFPFLIFFHAFANNLTYTLPYFTFVMYLKIILLFALYVIGVLIYFHHRTLPISERRFLLLELLTNPITYAVLLFHGQIDVILLAFLIGSLLILRQSPTVAKTLVAGLLYAASVATKTWSVIFLPLLEKYFGWKRTLFIFLTTIAFLFVDIFIYTRMVFGSAFRVVLPAVLKPGGPVGIWGISYLLKPWATFLANYNLYIFATLLGLGILFIRFRNFPLWRACVLFISWVYLVIPNWGVQYLFWVIPFLYFDKTPYRWIYLTYGGIYAWLNYASIALNNPVIPSPIIHQIGMGLWILIAVSTHKLASTHTETPLMSIKL